jgi:uncharacterized SAM-binding protein YcdF (DUF218 family)
MFLYLSKFLPLLVYPLGLACILILLALFIRELRWQRIVLGGALLTLYLGGNSWVANGLARSLEWRYVSPAETPHAQAIVVLAGDERAAHYPRQTPEIGEAGDREIYAAHLYRHGAAPLILFSGGAVVWLSADTSPGETVAYMLEMLGVPSSAIRFETASQNTYESAVACQKMLAAEGIQRIILVTSAVHMPRSVGLFERQGFEVIAAPTDYTVTQAEWEGMKGVSLPATMIGLLPSANNLNVTTRTLKEYIGLFIYKLQGWL